ncbi:MAG: twin-arginine translocase TatA/TatE family subunit [Chloroflexi bacterium]|nr:twin-arginine translocase TatA/TatE family subunit [Chloroflexota bacterium]|tara:strand:- start:27847 stop:28059 length:213 start_codon:yes stop_codon:yes gene_type:complete
MPFTRGIGIPELLIILVLVMIIFGVGRLPEVGGALGKAIREFRRVQSPDSKEDSNDTINQDADIEKDKVN